MQNWFKLTIKALPVYLFFIPVVVSAESDQLSDDPCWQHTQKLHHSSSKPIEVQLDGEIARYQPLVERALTYRAETIATAEHLKQKIDNNQPLSGADLDYMNQGMLLHLNLREQLFDVAFAHECWVNADDGQLKRWKINKQVQLKGVMLSLSAALMLYDNYLLAISIYEQDTKLRRFLNDSDSGYKIKPAQLLKVSASYNSIDNRARVRAALRWYEKRMRKYKFSNIEDDYFDYLQTLINQSPSYEMTRQFSPLFVISKYIQLLGNVSTDILSGLTNEGMNLFSALFGNTIGLIETRKGKLYERESVKQSLRRKLQPGDILLEKTPFRLTDKLIPGHWGHAAIWVGTELELRFLGIWDHPVVKPHQMQIRRGKLIVEALRSGVQLSSLSHFLNVDDVAVLRDETLTDKERSEHIIRSLRQVGKSYDFNFDVQTTDRIVCSELVYVVYIEIQWPTEKTLGRSTISPDHVAEKALNGGPLKLVSFYHDGRKVVWGSLGKMARLIKKE